MSNGDGSFAKLYTGVEKKIVHGEATGVPGRDGFALVLNTPWMTQGGGANYENLVSVNPDGSVTTRYILNTDPILAGNVAPYLTAIDANGDGIRDVVMLGRYGDNSNLILLNDGRGNLAVSKVLPNWVTGLYQAENAVAGDLNADGLPDMLVLHIDRRTTPNTRLSSLRAWINDGPGGFRDETGKWLGTNLQDYSGGFYDFNVVDLDGDGFPDLVLTVQEPRRSRSGKMVVLRNNGGRSFDVLNYGILQWDASKATSPNQYQPGSAVVLPVNGLPTVLFSPGGAVYSVRFVSQRAAGSPDLNQHGLTGSWYRPATSAQAIGTATLSFDTCTSGQLGYSLSSGTGLTGTIPLTRLTQNVTCSTTPSFSANADFALSGNWYGGAATSGQGFTIEVNPVSGAFSSAWYTHMPSGSTAGASGLRWYTAQGAFTPGMRSIPVTIYETTGGIFDTPPPPGQKTVAVGTGTMAIQSCTAATFSYNFSGGTSSGLSGSIALSRVGPVPPGCTS